MKAGRHLLAILVSAVAIGCGGGNDANLGVRESISEEGQAITTTASSRLSNFGITAGDSISVASRGSLLLDLFTIYNGTVIFYRYDGTWHPYVTVTAPSGVTFSDVAVTNNSQRLELIATGQSSAGTQLYYTHSTTSGTGALSFNSWTTVSGAVPYGGLDQLALVTWGSGRLDAFWVLPTTGNIGHAWGTNSLSDGTETGNTPSATYLQPLVASYGATLNAVSWGPGRLDLFIQGSVSQPLQHHWYDVNAGEWGSGTGVHREKFAVVDDHGVGFQTNPNTFAVLSSGVGKFELYTICTINSGANAFYHTSYSNGSWTMSGTAVAFDQITAQLVGEDTRDAIYWDVGGTMRRDIFGGYSGWQAYY